MNDSMKRYAVCCDCKYFFNGHFPGRLNGFGVCSRVTIKLKYCGDCACKRIKIKDEFEGRTSKAPWGSLLIDKYNLK